MFKVQPLEPSEDSSHSEQSRMKGSKQTKPTAAQTDHLILGKIRTNYDFKPQSLGCFVVHYRRSELKFVCKVKWNTVQ
jgi:hypothetical protein